MKHFTYLILCLSPLLGSCAPHYVRGSVNGISYDSSLDRGPVPGGVPWSVEIRMSTTDPTVGTLWVDGIDYGQVHSGQHVEVTSAAVVLVDGTPREPDAVLDGETGTPRTPER